MSDETAAPWDTEPTDPGAAEQATAKAMIAVNGLRELADFIEQHPETHNALGYNNLAVTINHPCNSRDEIVQTRRSLGGRWDKQESEDYFTIRRSFGPLANYDLYASRRLVCEKRVVGKKERVELAPDPEAVAALPLLPRTVEEEEIEWVCPPSLLALAGDGA